MLKSIISGIDIEQQLVSILSKIHTEGPSDPFDFEKLAYIKELHNDIFVKYEKKLLYLVGLFYKTENPESILEEVYSLYALAIEDEIGKKFTPVQADAYKKIHEKKYFSFFSPTSTGKSYLFRELIKQDQNDIVIVVPSRALIAEYIYVVRQLVGKDVLVLPFVDNINTSKIKRRIFVVTPERGVDLFKYHDEFKIDLFLLDEAQISEEEIRGMKFDSFVRRIDKSFSSAKKVFAHPFVNNPEAQLRKHGFNSASSTYMKYNQNTVGKICLSIDKGIFSYFSPYSFSTKKEYFIEKGDIVKKILENKGTLLIYTAKNKIYNGKYKNDFGGYIGTIPKSENSKALEFVKKLKDFIGATDDEKKEKYSVMIDMMERGIVIHHGSMPLKARFIIEDFVRNNHARICFATSTLNQGINMPFDVVWIDNFRNMDILSLKNLIGRAGRTTDVKNKFEYGYVIVKKINIPTFSTRLKENFNLKNTSLLEENIQNISDDLKDISEAIRTNTFDDELHLTQLQVERLKNPDTYGDVEFILNSLLDGDVPLTGNKYYEIPKETRKSIKEAFKNVFVKHLRRQELKPAEAAILSTAIPIMLWRIQGKSFREIVSLRYSFLSERDKKRKITSQIRTNGITSEQAQESIREIKIRYTPAASSLPDVNLRGLSLFPKGASVTDLDYDTLVYDTYDYLDKVISLSLADPITAALQLYYEKTKDKRALVMKNFIRYGTNDDIEIWLSRYGFGFEDIDWVKEHIESIDEKGIVFKLSINTLDEDKKELIKRYT